MEKVFCLFAGRHPIPGNPPAIFKEGIDPMDFDALHAAANAAIPAECTEVSVYVTGLTPGMLAVVEVCFQRRITLKAYPERELGGRRFDTVVATPSQRSGKWSLSNSLWTRIIQEIISVGRVYK